MHVLYKIYGVRVWEKAEEAEANQGLSFPSGLQE